MRATDNGLAFPRVRHSDCSVFGRLRPCHLLQPAEPKGVQLRTRRAQVVQPVAGSLQAAVEVGVPRQLATASPPDSVRIGLLRGVSCPPLSTQRQRCALGAAENRTQEQTEADFEYQEGLAPASCPNALEVPRSSVIATRQSPFQNCLGLLETSRRLSGATLELPWSSPRFWRLLELSQRGALQPSGGFLEICGAVLELSGAFWGSPSFWSLLELSQSFLGASGSFLGASGGFWIATLPMVSVRKQPPSSWHPLVEPGHVGDPTDHHVVQWENSCPLPYPLYLSKHHSPPSDCKAADVIRVLAT